MKYQYVTIRLENALAREFKLTNKTYKALNKIALKERIGLRTLLQTYIPILDHAVDEAVVRIIKEYGTSNAT